jgi:hypothetical protein
MGLMDKDKSNAGEGPRQVPDAEQVALHAILEALAASDEAVLARLTAENPDLVEVHLVPPDLRDQIRQALTAEGDPAFARLTERTRRRLEDLRAVPSTAAELADKDTPVSPLTYTTGQLTPEQAHALYRKISPLVVFEIMRTLDRSANVAIVQEIADRICSDEVLTRLRACRHVRDGIIDELCRYFGESGIRAVLDRERLLEIMEECGALNDVTTMANCIRMSQVKAG